MDFDGEWGNQYTGMIEQIIPGYEGLSHMVLAILRAHLATSGSILVIGAGGGNELLSFAMEGWEITGIDPSRRMLQLAEQRLSRIKPRSSIHLVNERFENMEKGKEFDAATSILVMHFIPDESSKADFLKKVFLHLKEGGIYIHVDLCEPGNAHKETAIKAQIAYLMDTGIFHNHGEAEKFINSAMAGLHLCEKARLEELFGEAGFSHIQQFYQGFAYCGWMMKC